MFVAVDTWTERAMLGSEVTAKDAMDSSSRYRCLICNSTLKYNPSPEDLFDHFQHIDREDDCINTGNVSRAHRLGQVVICKKLFNWLPESSVDIDIERRIGDHSDFIISDVQVGGPYHVTAEIVHQNPSISLRRRLRTLFDQGYAVLIVVLTTARISPKRFDRHLQDSHSVQVGSFNPETLEVQFGSLLTPNNIDPEDFNRSDVPSYMV